MEHIFHTLKIARTESETADAKTFYLEIPEDLKDLYRYTAGQYLTFRIHQNGEEVRRSYSLCTYEGTDPQPGVTVKRVDDGRMSNYMNDNLKPGDSIEVMPPFGKFTVIPESGRNNHYVLFAGGSGITPCMGIAKAVLKDEPGSQVSLVYANRNPESVIFKDQLASLEKEHSGRFKVYHNYDAAPLTWFGLKGYLTEDKVVNILHQKIGGRFPEFGYYICGPSPMMDIVKKGLAKAGVPSSNIHNEYFAAPVSDKKVEEIPAPPADFNGSAQVTVNVYGKTKTITCDEKTTLLNAAMKNGIDPPYSCTVGVCTTCRAKVHKGEVYMMEREGLTDDEINEGYVLTCQSLPRSSEIEITYE
ncbi:MAG: ferredoxin--NADP reductase [Bacteroidetes bacterium]|nr:ferredoxin--NADP reductase [Bacteroidota bacterium]